MSNTWVLWNFLNGGSNSSIFLSHFSGVFKKLTKNVKWRKESSRLFRSDFLKALSIVWKSGRSWNQWNVRQSNRFSKSRSVEDFYWRHWSIFILTCMEFDTNHVKVDRFWFHKKRDSLGALVLSEILEKLFHCLTFHCILLFISQNHSWILWAK